MQWPTSSAASIEDIIAADCKDKDSGTSNIHLDFVADASHSHHQRPHDGFSCADLEHNFEKAIAGEFAYLPMRS